MCAQQRPPANLEPFRPDVLAAIKTAVAAYLPGVHEAQMAFSRLEVSQGGGNGTELAQAKGAGAAGAARERYVITLSRSLSSGPDSRPHRQVVCVVFSGQSGQIVKMAMSK